jgi:hypothetical protein
MSPALDQATAYWEWKTVGPSTRPLATGWHRVRLDNRTGETGKRVAWDALRVTRTAAAGTAGAPAAPTGLAQFRANGATGIGLGSATPDSTAVLKGGVSDPNGDAVALDLEIRPVGNAFLGTPTCTSAVVASGSTATASCGGLEPGAYHWRGRTRDAQGATSAWMSAGSNLDGQPDFVVINVAYLGHFSYAGWAPQWIWDGQTAGMPGGNPMEALALWVSTYGITYQAHVAYDGWLPWVGTGVAAGTTGAGKTLQAIRIALTGAAASVHVVYRVYVQGLGWQAWVSDGAVAGTVGQGLAVQAIEVRVQ